MFKLNGRRIELMNQIVHLMDSRTEIETIQSRNRNTVHLDKSFLIANLVKWRSEKDRNKLV